MKSDVWLVVSVTEIGFLRRSVVTLPMRWSSWSHSVTFHWTNYRRRRSLIGWINSKLTFPMEKSAGTGANLLPNVILPGTWKAQNKHHLTFISNEAGEWKSVPSNWVWSFSVLHWNWSLYRTRFDRRRTFAAVDSSRWHSASFAIVRFHSSARAHRDLRIASRVNRTLE